MIYTMQDRLHENTSGTAVGLRSHHTRASVLKARRNGKPEIGKALRFSIFLHVGGGFWLYCASPPRLPPTNRVLSHPLH